MLKKELSLLLKILFWASPVIFWSVWQIIMVRPELFWVLASSSLILLLPVAYEAAGRKKNWRFLYILLSLLLSLASYYLFISFLASPWQVELLWLLVLVYFYRYLWAAKKMANGGEAGDWMLITMYGCLFTYFLASSSLFGLQSFLSLSPWLLLLAFIPFVFASIRSLAFSQGWNHHKDIWIWPLLTLLSLQIAMMLLLLPLNYLVAGILNTLAFYSMVNFLRLYNNKNLTRRKIKNYAWFSALSLIIILLTARWL